MYLNSKHTDGRGRGGEVGVAVGACLNAWQLSAHRISVLDHRTKTHREGGRERKREKHPHMGKEIQRYKVKEKGVGVRDEREASWQCARCCWEC